MKVITTRLQLTDNTLGYSMEDNPEELFIAGQQKAFIDAALLALTPRAERVIRWYYFEGHTHKEIAIMCDVTTERIHQIKTKALTKLRGKRLACNLLKVL